MPADTRSCNVASSAMVRIAPGDMAARRKAPGPPCGAPVQASFLKHADEQTVACLSAVLHAIDAAGLAPDGPAAFRCWGVVGGPRFIGRDVVGREVPEFRKEGPWGVSPHVIPHRSLHSPSGAVSVALSIRGPNLGAGGGNGGEAEALLSALALLWGQGVPGVWLLLSRLEASGEAVGCALALTADGTGPSLALRLGDVAGETLTPEALLAGRPCAVPGVGRVAMRPARLPAAR